MRDSEDCPTCNGYVLNAAGHWVRTRETVGLVCQTCGHDYGAYDEAGAP